MKGDNMSWNHRVLVTDCGDGELWFLIHEVYYDDNNIPNGYTASGAVVGGYDLVDIQWDLDRFQECLNKPFLWSGDRFPEEFKGELKTNGS